MPELDRAVLFERLQQILNNLYATVNQHLTILPKFEQPFESFSSPDGNVTGSLLTFPGKEIDKLVYSWLKNADYKFGTMRLSLWLNPRIQVPHLAFNFGISPTLFFYIDYISRVDLWTDIGYAERYYEPVNSAYMELRRNSNVSVFVSEALYIRQLQSPTMLYFTCPQTEESLALIEKTTHEMYSRWLTWVQQATPVPADAQAGLAERDLMMRRISAERDPGNAVAAKIFGVELADRLVQALWSPETNQS